MDLDLNNDPHRRLNILTGEWVFVSPQRAKRPWQGQSETPSAMQLPSYDADCYLCPGNTRAGGEQNPDYTDTFAFTNDFAALKADANPANFQEGYLVAEGDRGTCRVLCYSPDHSKTMAQLSIEEIEKVIQLWQSQYQELGALEYINHVQIFENKGEMMGCSNPHPHGQIWSQSAIPSIIDRKSNAQFKFYQDTECQSLLSAYLEQEIAEESRIVCVDEHFVAVVPWWAVWPFEVMVAPRRPMQDLTQLAEEEITAFAKTLATLTQKYDGLFNTSFPYSMGIHQAPTDDQAQDHWHWHMEFKPPLLRSATVKKHMVGYELFATAQRDITAEKAADMLRAVEVE